MAVVRWNRVYTLGVGLLAAACSGGGDGGTQPPGPPTQVAPTGGNGQSWYFNNALPTPYSVTVRDANNRAVPSVSVEWAIITGGGSLSSNTSNTNSSGVATTVHTLGSATTYVVRATVSGVSAPADFSASAAAPPTSAAVDVKDNLFSPASAVIKTGGTVTWTWAGAVAHNVTFTGGPTPRPANGPNQVSGTYTTPAITTVGTYNYTCTNHSGMNGTVTVVN